MSFTKIKLNNVQVLFGVLTVDELLTPGAVSEHKVFSRRSEISFTKHTHQGRLKHTHSHMIHVSPSLPSQAMERTLPNGYHYFTMNGFLSLSLSSHSPVYSLSLCFIFLFLPQRWLQGLGRPVVAWNRWRNSRDLQPWCELSSWG